MRLYVLGDIHGHLDLLQQAHQRIHDDGGPDALIVHVGDLIDRGPDSRGVVDYLMRGQQAGRPWIVTRGNHDRFLPALLTQPDWIDPNLSSQQHWVGHPGLGAAATLESYGIDVTQPWDAILTQAHKAVPLTHIQFLTSLPLWYLHPLALIVHAGIRPNVDLCAQIEDDLVWIRKPFLESRVDFGPLIVHGHSAIETPTLYPNRLNMDGGAAYGRALIPAVIEPGRVVHLLTNTGRHPLLAQDYSETTRF